MRFRKPDGRPAKLTLGPVDLSSESTDAPVIGGPLTLPQARELAAAINRRRARGEDVIADIKAQAARADAAATLAATNTFGAAAREFFADHRTRHGERPRGWRRNARLIGLHYPPETDEPEVIPGSLAATWADKPITSIDSHDIYTAVDDARRHGIPGLARHNAGISAARGRKMHAALSVLFGYLLQHRKVAINPCAGVWRPAPPNARERTLTEPEIKIFWRAADEAPVPYNAIFQVLLLTGCRLNEVSGMCRSELSDGGTWTIPSARTKNYRPHILALPSLAREIIMGVLGDNEYVFAGAISGRAVSAFSEAKSALDKNMPGVAPWRLHDLRRTAATGMAELGIAPHIVEAVLNHVSGARAGVAGIYNRALYAEEKKTALVRWATHIAGLVADKPSNVTPMQRHSK